MTHATRRPPKTIDDFLALPDEVRAELIGGEIYMTPAPTPRHSEVVARLGGLLIAWARAGDRGRTFVAPCDVHLPSGDMVQPDVFFVSKANAGIVGELRIRGVPDLLVEVVSPTHGERDRIVKRNLYVGNRVPESWLVDLGASAIEVLRLRGFSYRPAGYFLRGSVLETPTLPGLRLPVDDVFG